MNTREANNSKLSASKIIQIVWHWIIESPATLTAELLDINPNTVVDWFNFCREICELSNSLHSDRTKLGDGTGRIDGNLPQVVVQIDESLLRGRRKYNRGRLLQGNQAIPADDHMEFELHAGENDGQDDNNRNHGHRIQGPWIFGLAECHLTPAGKYDTREVRLFYVERRNHETLIPIITENCAPGSVIWSDEWLAYRRIPETYQHQTVNHSQEFVNGDIHTQNIERYWASLKHKIMRCMKGSNMDLLETHLAEFSWRSRHRNTDRYQLFDTFLSEAAFFHPILWVIVCVTIFCICVMLLLFRIIFVFSIVMKYLCFYDFDTFNSHFDFKSKN